jgi:hypothetical protein
MQTVSEDGSVNTFPWYRIRMQQWKNPFLSNGSVVRNSRDIVGNGVFF